MRPILFEIGFLSVKTYGVFVAAAFLAGFAYLKLRSKRLGVPNKFVYDFAFYALISALAGARLLYVVLDAGYFLKNPAEIFKIWEGGLVFFGGLAGGFAGGLAVVKRYKIKDWLAVADLTAPALALAHAIGRIGCFFAGCCYGRQTTCACGVVFHNTDSFAPLSVRLIPVQLMESAGNFAIFIILNALIKKSRPSGYVFAGYVFLYSVLRFTLEFFRGDFRGWMFYNFSTLQIVSALAAVASLVYILKLKNAN